MDHWICSCGKKVAIRLTVCPYCKIKNKTSEYVTGRGTNQLLIIGALVVIIICMGGYLFFKKDTVQIVVQPKPVHVVQQTSAPANNTSNSNHTSQPPQQQNTGGSSGTKIVSRKIIYACISLSELSQFGRIVASGDKAAFSQVILDGNKCDYISIGSTVYIENVSSDGIATIRPEGAVKSLYTYHTLLQDKYQLGQ